MSQIYLQDIHDKVLLECHDAQKYESPYLGPLEVTDVFTNGSVTIKKGLLMKGLILDD